MPKNTNPIRQVVKVTQSPMNPLQWLLTLHCGHEIWVTSKSRPLRVYQKCPACGAGDVPKNLRQPWRLGLACGHEEWVTSESRPQIATRQCALCRKKVEVSEVTSR